MTQRGHSTQQTGKPSGLIALFPLVMVFAAIAFLAVGAGRTGQEPSKMSREATTPAQAAGPSQADEAAAAAVVAISLARVAPRLPEEALAPPESKSQPQPQSQLRQATPDPMKAAKPAARREAQPASQPPALAQPPVRPQADQPDAPPPAAETQPKDEGVLSRIGSYAPSPKRIASAVTEGVSKLASYIPGL